MWAGGRGQSWMYSPGGTSPFPQQHTVSGNVGKSQSPWFTDSAALPGLHKCPAGFIFIFSGAHAGFSWTTPNFWLFRAHARPSQTSGFGNVVPCKGSPFSLPSAPSSLLAKYLLLCFLKLLCAEWIPPFFLFQEPDPKTKLMEEKQTIRIMIRVISGCVSL